MNRSLFTVFLISSVLLIALGFNTIDQMIIRYRYYDDWRNMETWEMSHFLAPNWWNIYAASIVMLIAGGFILGWISKGLA